MEAKHYKSSCTALALAAALGLMSQGCSGSAAVNDAGGGVVAITSIADLPQSSSPVVAGDSASALVMDSFKHEDGVGTATTGMKLGALNAFDFAHDGVSLAACETYNQTKWAIASSVQGDLIQCYISNTMKAGSDAGLILDGDGHAVTIDDGSYHILALEGGDDADAPDKIKFKITKNASGNVTGFEFFSCKSGTQNTYLSQTIDGHDFTMTVKNNHSRLDPRSNELREGRDSVVVTGKLDDDGRFVDSFEGESTPKQILMRFLNTSDSDSFHGAFDVSQYATRMVIDSTMGGTNTFVHDDVEYDCSFQNQIFSDSQLLDGNVAGEDYDIGLLALGDGASNQAFDNTCNSVHNTMPAVISAWTGDNRLVLDPATDSPFYVGVTDTTLQEDMEPIVEFEDGQTFDCDEAAESTVNFTAITAAAGSNPLAACSNLELDQSHIDCYQVVHEGRKDDRDTEGGDNGGGDHDGGDAPTLCGGLTSGSPVSDENMATFCSCNGEEDSEQCSMVTDTCQAETSTMGECLTLLLEHD